MNEARRLSPKEAGLTGGKPTTAGEAVVRILREDVEKLSTSELQTWLKWILPFVGENTSDGRVVREYADLIRREIDSRRIRRSALIAETCAILGAIAAVASAITAGMSAHYAGQALNLERQKQQIEKRAE